MLKTQGSELACRLTQSYASAGEEEAEGKKGKVTEDEREKKNSLASREPVGVVEAAVNGDHQEESMPQPPEEEEE